MNKIISILTKFPDQIKKRNEEIHIIFWFKLFSGMSIFYGILSQLYLISINNGFGAVKFFSISQLAIDGFIILLLSFFVAVIVTLTYFWIYIFIKFNWLIKIFFLLGPICLFLLLKIVAKQDWTIFFTSFAVLPALFLFGIRDDWIGLILGLIPINAIGIYTYVFGSYNLVEIDGIKYEINYVSNDYIFTKDGNIFDREGNKFIKSEK